MPNQYTSKPEGTLTDQLQSKGFKPLQANHTWIDEDGNILRLNGNSKSKNDYPYTLNSKKIRSLNELNKEIV